MPAWVRPAEGPQNGYLDTRKLAAVRGLREERWSKRGFLRFRLKFLRVRSV